MPHYYNIFCCILQFSFLIWFDPNSDPIWQLVDVYIPWYPCFLGDSIKHVRYIETNTEPSTEILHNRNYPFGQDRVLSSRYGHLLAIS